MISQAAMGTFLKLHVMEGSRTRRIAQRAHSIAGRAFPVVGWSQMILGGIAALGFCFGDHFGQCLAHFIMGSSFIGYGILLLLMARFGASFLARHNTSQDFLDSMIICVWGLVNIFTEHDFLVRSIVGILGPQNAHGFAREQRRKADTGATRTCSTSVSVCSGSLAGY